MKDFWLGGELGPAGSLDWTAPQWVVVVAVAAAVLAWGVSFIGDRRLPARLFEVALWGLALAGVVVAIAQPVWVEEQGRVEPGRLAVLVDGSRSMGILENGTARADLAKALADRLDASDVDFYTFGDDLAVGRPAKADQDGTDLESALDALSERVAGEKLAGVVVLTDGLDRGLLRRRYAEEERPRPPTLPGPLTVYQVGTPGDLRDLAVRSVDAGGYAFLRSPFRITAHVEGVGFENRSVTTSLLRDGLPVTSQKVALGPDGKGEVSFEVVPEKAGRFTYTVRVPVYEHDAVPANNAMPLVVRVVRDKLRVLQVTGTPSWDVKFLRRFLKGDPSVDLVSFFILRTTEDLGSGYRQDELSLIEFPYQRLFREELWSFDLVIFQNFDYAPYFERESAELLANIRDYVTREGGAFVMVGGDRSFDLGGYANTPIAELLPIELGVPGEKASLAPFPPTLTEAGARHPVTRLVSDEDENAAWWSRLHDMDGTNVVRGAKPDAAVLLSHPTQRTAAGDPMPVLSVREAGAGRAMALTVDASWRWSFSEAAEGRGNQAYLRFWKNAIRWLVGDPTASRVAVDTPRENYGVGDVVRVVVRARDPGFGPLPAAEVEATVTGEEGASRLKGRTGTDGEVVLEYPAARRGAHRVQVHVTDDGQLVGSAETVFAVTTRDPELDEVVPDATFLQRLAASTGGRYVAPGEWAEPVRDASSGRTVWDRRETPLARAPLLALWIGVFAGIAWIVRRRSGLR